MAYLRGLQQLMLSLARKQKNLGIDPKGFPLGRGLTRMPSEPSQTKTGKGYFLGRRHTAWC
jgi:hypothetical protein